LIPQMKTTDSYKYVGVNIALDGNMDTQIKDLHQKCTSFATLFNQSYFNTRDARQGFVTIFIPSVCYPLATTSITKTILQDIQRPIIHAVLSRLGFNSHMPRCIVFASRKLGGLGLLDLYSEQVASQIKLLITHLRAKSYLHNSI
jgi:hypothetical protein